MKYLENSRHAGILAHITSLPSVYGIGDIGTSSYQFLDFLEKSGQSCWQILPTGPTNPLFDNSPYMSSSAFAGSPLLISPDLLFQEGLLDRADLDNSPTFSPYTTEFSKVIPYKINLCNKAFTTFTQNTSSAFETFCKNTPWLADYTLFMALKEKYSNQSWSNWPEAIRSRKPKSLDEERTLLKARIEYFCFEQYEFSRQWGLLRQQATAKDIKIFGDIPIYVSLDSADVWANQKLFSLDKTGHPLHVAGVPPDYFCTTGQRWGNPLYLWDSTDPKVRKSLINWWAERFRGVFTQVDIARIDHFRAFESYWAIPAACDTAVDGVWLKGPGIDFFNEIHNRLGPLEIVAEDLGIITEEVNTLRNDLNFPGMKVLQFAFDGNAHNDFLPHNFKTSNCVCYTGTHDNETSLGWYLSNALDDKLRTVVKRIANRRMHDESPIQEDLIFLSHASIAALSIIPLQDILGFGSDCRMNTPGVAHGNWRWRCAPEFLTNEIAENTNRLCKLFGR